MIFEKLQNVLMKLFFVSYLQSFQNAMHKKKHLKISRVFEAANNHCRIELSHHNIPSHTCGKCQSKLHQYRLYLVEQECTPRGWVQTYYLNSFNEVKDTARKRIISNITTMEKEEHYLKDNRWNAKVICTMNVRENNKKWYHPFQLGKGKFIWK